MRYECAALGLGTIHHSGTTMFIQISAIDLNERPIIATINRSKIRHIRAVSYGHPRCVLSLDRVDSPEVLHLPISFVQAKERFPELVEAQEYSPAETRIIGKLLLNPSAILTIRPVGSAAYKILFSNGSAVTVLGLPPEIENATLSPTA